jgi:hypothetical protein
MPYISLPHFVGNAYIPTGSAYFGSVGTLNSTSLITNKIDFVTQANLVGSNLNAGKTGGAGGANLQKGLFTGGSPSGSYVSATSLTTFTVGTWASSTALSQAGGTRTQGQAAGPTAVLVCGGFNGAQLNFVNRFLWSNMTRTSLTALTVARFGVASFGTASEAFFWTGATNVSLNSTQDADKYNYATGAKTALGAIGSTPRIYSAYFSAPTVGYAVGGQPANLVSGGVATAQKFVYASLAVTTTAALLAGSRTAARGAANASSAYVAGGQNTSSINQSTNDRITLATDTTSPSTALWDGTNPVIGAHIPSLSSSPAWAA